MKPVILVCGSEGQLGKCLRDLAKNIDYLWNYSDIDTLDITDKNAINHAIKTLRPDVVVNCSVYRIFMAIS